MRSRRSIPTLLTVVLWVLASALAAAQQDGAKAAQQSVETWLSLVDVGDYPATYDSAAAFFRNAITQEKWVASIQTVREPLGYLNARTVKSTTVTSTLPGAPDGEDVVFQFNAKFERKLAAVETVTVVREPDGVWRVVGYFIR